MAASSSSLTFRDIAQRINCEPITRKDLLTSNPRLFCIYTNEAGQEPQFVAAEEKTRGTALGTFYDMVARLSFLPTRWLGKVGLPTGHLRDDPNSIRTRTAKDINLDTILEILGYTLYQELGRNLFVVPNTFLSKQPIMNAFSTGHALAVEWVSLEIRESLRIMCELVPGYQDFSQAVILENGQTIPFMEFLRKNHRPPTTLLSPSGTAVPLLGIIELLAVMRALADTDGLGGKGENAGFIWVKEGETVIAARAVKIDPGCVFRFAVEEEGQTCENRVINTYYNLGNPRYHLKSRRNLQIANNDSSVDIHWSSLSHEQREVFLSTLMNCLRYRTNEGVLKLLFHRDGKFNRSTTEQISEEISDKLIKQALTWLKLQEKLYSEDLKAFYIAHPEQLLRIQYIDTYGQLPLPTSDETFPIRELFTELVLMDQGKNEQSTTRNDPAVPETDSLRDTFNRLNHVEKQISLEDLFNATESQPAPRKLLLLGRAGIGKTTICQKIAHDWASGKLWNDRYTAVYWLPLRQCNHFLEEESDPRKWLSQALARLILNQEFLESSIESQLRNHPQQILIVLDGYDEATPDLAHRVKELLQISELNLFITSRPGHTEQLSSLVDRTVENMGFSDDQIESYTDRFLQRGQRTSAYADSQKTSLLSALKKDRNLFGLAHIPLQLQMLCSLWEKGASTRGFPSTLTALYRTMVQEIFRWQCRREKIDPDDVPPRERINLYNCLGDIALTGLRGGKLLISEEALQQALDRFDISHKKLLASGLLKAVGEGAQREYYFIHLSYQEYMIALSIAQKTPQEREQFILTYRYHPQFQLVFGFLAGIIHHQDTASDKIEVKRFFETLHAIKTGPNGEIFGVDIVGSYQLELTLRCLSECDSQIQLWAEERYHIYEVLKELIETWKTNDRAIRVFKLNKISAVVMNDMIHKAATEVQSPSHKINAAESLGFIGSRASPDGWEKAIATLKEALKDQSVEVRKKALESLKAFIHKKLPPEKWKEVFETLKETLKDPSEDIRRSATYYIGDLAKKTPPDKWREVFETLKEALKDQSKDVRKAALHSFRSLGENADLDSWRELFRTLKECLKNPNLDVQSEAVNSSISLGEKAPSERWQVFFEVIIEALKREDLKNEKNFFYDSAFSYLRSFAEKASSDRWREVFDSLKQEFKDLSLNVQNAVISSLLFQGKNVSPEKWNTVWAVVQEFVKPESEFRLTAVRSLGSFGRTAPPEKWEDVWAVIQEFLKPVSEFRILAIGSLGSLSKNAPSEKREAIWAVIKEASKDQNMEIRRVAVQQFDQYLDSGSSLERWKEVWALLKEASKDPAIQVRSTVLSSLEYLGSRAPPERWRSAWEILKMILKDQHYYIRKEAVCCLGCFFKHTPPDKTEEVLAAYKDAWKDESEEIQAAAGDVLDNQQKILPGGWKDTWELFKDIIRIKKNSDYLGYIVNCFIRSFRRAPFEQWGEVMRTINQIPGTDYYRTASIQYYFKSMPLEKWDSILFTQGLDLSWSKLFVDGCIEHQKPLCFLQLHPEQSSRLYFGQRHEDSRPFTPEVIRMLQQVVAEGPLAKYVASYSHKE